MMSELERMREISSKAIVGTATQRELQEVYAYFEAKIALEKITSDNELIFLAEQAD